MPHCVLELSSNVEDNPDFRQFFSKLHAFIITVSDVALETLKSRVAKYDQYYIGSGRPEVSFIYLTISMMSGRSEKVRQEISQGALALLCEFFPCARDSGSCSINVGIQELNRETYSKLLKDR